jgi:Icc-related predicted phosphoesterase
VRLRLRGLQVYRLGPAEKEEPLYRLELLGSYNEVPCRSQSLKIVAFSDWRVQGIGGLIRFLKAQRGTPDLIVYAGDDIQRFRPPGKNLFEDIAKLSKFGLCAVAGNDDTAATRELICGRGVHQVHSLALVLGRFAVVGVEGAPLFPNDSEGRNRGHLLYPERVLSCHMRAWNSNALNHKKLIVVSHAPPFGVLDFAVRFGPRHIGNRPLREFLESSSHSLLCICGHVHRCGGQSTELRNVQVVNVASHDRPGESGRVAVIQIRTERVSAIAWHLLS